MGNPVVQLSCETKQTGGLTIRHENCNTKHIVPSSPDFICQQIRSNKSSNQVQNQPAIYLPMAQKIRRNTAVPCG